MPQRHSLVVGKLVESLEGDIEAGRRIVNSEDIDSGAVVRQLPAAAAERGVPRDTLYTTDEGEVRKRAEIGVSCISASTVNMEIPNGRGTCLW